MKSLVLTCLLFSPLLTFISCTRTVNTNTVAETRDSIVKAPLTATSIGESNYLISIPANYKITETEGPDFTVYYFNSSDSTDTVSFSGGMYFGNHPSKFKPANDSCITDVLTGSILESNAEWTVYNCKGLYSVQAIAESKSGEHWNELVHAFGNGTSDTDIELIIDIFATLKKKE